MKQWLLYLCMLFGLALVGLAGYGLAIARPRPKPLLIERVMQIQIEVGCEKIDGEIGPETKEKVNAKTESQKIILFNRYAMESMERMASGRLK